MVWNPLPLIVSVLAKLAVDEMNSADSQWVYAGNAKKNNNWVNITNTH